MKVDAKWLDRVASYTVRDLGLQDTGEHGELFCDLIADLREARTALAEIGDGAEAAFKNVADSAQALKALRNISKRARAAIAVACPTCGTPQPATSSRNASEAIDSEHLANGKDGGQR